MDFLLNYPDISIFFSNYKIEGTILNDRVVQDLQNIYSLYQDLDFLRKNTIAIDMIIKELIQNSIKANIKRWVLDRYKLNPENEQEYYKSLRILKHILYFIKVEDFEKKDLEFNYNFKVYLSFHPEMMIIHVLNQKSLFSIEEHRVRNKFKESEDLDTLYEYYLKFSDTEEGAGMGIAIINLLLKQIGLNSRNFSIFSFFDGRESYTVSRVIIPFKNHKLLPRQKFDIYCQKQHIVPESLRELLNRKLIYISFL